MQKSERKLTQCYIDESIHSNCDFIVTAFVFAKADLDQMVAGALQGAGLIPKVDEYKSSARMDSNPKMQAARKNLLRLANLNTKVAIYFGPYERETLGKHSLQALQSVLVRNGIDPHELLVYFDEGIFPSTNEAERLCGLFHFLSGCKIHPRENSRERLGIQVADAVAHSFGQIMKEELTGTQKLVDIGGPGTGYSEGTQAPLGWELLMTLRYGLLNRPMVYNGESYDAAIDQVILDPINDDPADYGQHPILLGWGIQVAPEANEKLRQGVERALGRIWFGCIH